MKLELESGLVIAEANENDVRKLLEGEEFAVLSVEPYTYIQCAEREDAPDGYVLEYQDGTLDEHYQAVDGPIALDRVVEAFVKYLHGDPSWRDDFQWEKMDLS